MQVKSRNLYLSLVSSRDDNELDTSNGNASLHLPNISILVGSISINPVGRFLFGLLRRITLPFTSIVDSLGIALTCSFSFSSETVTKRWTGTGYNPEGPAGVEGQVPPAYKDLQGLVARYGKDQSESRYETSKKQTTVNKTPWQINGISVSVLIDGITVKERDASGNYIESENGGIQRSYVPVDEETLRSLRSAVEGAIRYDQNRGDIVEVRNVQFDRTAEFEQEDNAYRTSKKVKQALFATLLTLVVLLSLIFLIRTIVHWRERRRKLRVQ